jgi:hypothetical protein
LTRVCRLWMANAKPDRQGNGRLIGPLPHVVVFCPPFDRLTLRCI